MIKRQIIVFLLRWLASSVGMYFCITHLGTINPESSATFSEEWILFAVAGLIFSVINTVIKPLIKMLTLPLAILTMGISTLIVNTAMVVLTIYLLPSVEMDFWGAFLSSILLSAINYVLNLFIG